MHLFIMLYYDRVVISKCYVHVVGSQKSRAIAASYPFISPLIAERFTSMRSHPSPPGVCVKSRYVAELITGNARTVSRKQDMPLTIPKRFENIFPLPIALIP